jgi:hypothetical protein
MPAAGRPLHCAGRAGAVRDGQEVLQREQVLELLDVCKAGIPLRGDAVESRAAADCIASGMHLVVPHSLTTFNSKHRRCPQHDAT